MPTESFDPSADLPFERRLAQADMAALYAYWRELGGGRPPAFRAFDPIAVPRLLPSLQITRRDAGRRHRIGLTGENIVALAGRNNTGRYLDEVMADDLYAARIALYDEALETGRPIAYRSFLAMRGREHYFYKRLLLPFVETGPAPDLLLALAVTAAVPPGEGLPLPSTGIIEILRPGAAD